MISYDERVLVQVLKQFEGMTKIKVYDILQKIEEILIHHESPIKLSTYDESLHKIYTSKNALPIGEYGFCYVEDQCDYICIIKIKTLIPKILGGENTYFTKGMDGVILPFTSKNIKKAFEDTHLKNHIYDFLKTNHLKKRNPKTKRLIIMEILDTIDPDHVKQKDVKL